MDETVPLRTSDTKSDTEADRQTIFLSQDDRSTRDVFPTIDETRYLTSYRRSSDPYEVGYTAMG